MQQHSHHENQERLTLFYSGCTFGLNKEKCKIYSKMFLEQKERDTYRMQNVTTYMKYELFRVFQQSIYNPKNGVFWDVTPCGSCKKDGSEELSASFIRGTRIGERGPTLAGTSNLRTLRRNTLMTEALCSSKTSALTRATRRNIPEHGILYGIP
jgi:hypothetical protein